MAVKRYTKKQKAEALKRIKGGESVRALSRELEIPRTTLLGWKKAAEKKDETTPARARKKTAQAREEKLDSPTIASVQDETEEQTQNEAKKNFSKKSWDNIDKAQRIIDRRLSRALDYEAEIDKIVETLADMGEDDLSYNEKQALLAKLRKIKVSDLRDVVVLIGTLYDKQALANKESTMNVDGGMVVNFGIPRPPKTEGETEDVDKSGPIVGNHA